jgi:hypothetical protein
MSQNPPENVVEVALHALFIPLRKEYFEAFERGEKVTEYRMHGPRWNEKTCKIGRRVTLSLGYGKQRRLTGTINDFRLHYAPEEIPGWEACYGPRTATAACIGITLDGMNK